MDGALTPVTGAEARAAIAAAVLGQRSAPAVIGSVRLHEHQRIAVALIEASFTEFGGALLADATGLGKTYVALAVASRARTPVVIAPAALRPMWQKAAAASGCDLPFTSVESLSRGRLGSMPKHPDLVIVDEAHHVRNPATARYRALMSLTTRARVLLLSATPLHNTGGDVTALLSLFLGARAATLDAASAMRCIVRRTASATSSSIPSIGEPRQLTVPDDECRIDAIVSLPPPIPPRDGGDGGALLVYSLLRRWASSQGALAESLRRRLARGGALLDALETGRHPSATELAAWSLAEGTVQLAFPELVVAQIVAPEPASTLAVAIRAHAESVRALLADLGRTDDLDAARAARLIDIRAAHPGERIVAFTQYADTVGALFRHLQREPSVAALTSTGARVAGGLLSRAEALARFAPRAQGATPVGPGRAIDLLLTTDLLSEGVNLQDASVVVHLDLPWTPARLEQRVGRVARLGSMHDRVTVYAFRPPASTERIVCVEERLRAKLAATARAVGVVGTILPSLALAGAAMSPESPPECSEAIRAMAERWRFGASRASPESPASPASPASHGAQHRVVATVHARVTGFIALLQDANGVRLVADFGSGPTEDPATVIAAMDAADGPDADTDPQNVQSVLGSLERWRSASRTRSEITLDGALHARSRRSVVERIAAITRRTPRHLRPTISALAAAARQTVSGCYGAGAERVLDELASAAMPDEAWLRAVSTFGAVHGRGMREPVAADRKCVVALLLLSNDRTG